MIFDFHKPTPAAMKAAISQLSILEKLDELKAKVSTYGDNDKKIDYSHVGSLAHIDEQLKEILAFLNS